MISSLTGLPAVFVRKEAKTYGTCKLAEGGDFSGRTVTLIEDIVTTGLSSRETVAELESLGAKVLAVACLIDRSDGEADCGGHVDQQDQPDALAVVVAHGGELPLGRMPRG